MLGGTLASGWQSNELDRPLYIHAIVAFATPHARECDPSPTRRDWIQALTMMSIMITRHVRCLFSRTSHRHSHLCVQHIQLFCNRFPDSHIPGTKFGNPPVSGMSRTTCRPAGYLSLVALWLNGDGTLMIMYPTSKMTPRACRNRCLTMYPDLNARPGPVCKA